MQQQGQMLPLVRQQELQEQQFQQIVGRKRSVPEPAERQQARYVSF